MQRLQHLETLKIDGRVSAVPWDIVHLPGLLHLSLPVGTNMPNGIRHMTSLCTLGYFDLNVNSVDNVHCLGMLTNLQDLRLTCSTEVPSYYAQNQMNRLGSIIAKLCNIRSLTLEPSSIVDVGPSSMNISCDGLRSMSSPPELLQRFEWLPHICTFSGLPKWIGYHRKLRIVKIGVMRLATKDVDVLGGFSALAILSLYVRTKPAERILFSKTAFSFLKYFEFSCSIPYLQFEAETMPKLQKLKLGFDAHRVDEHGVLPLGIEHLLGLKEICAEIGGASANDCDAKVTGSVLSQAIMEHPGHPILNIQCVDGIFSGKDDDNNSRVQEEEYMTLQKQYVIKEEDSDSVDINSRVQEGEKNLQKQYEVMEEDSIMMHPTDRLSDFDIHLLGGMYTGKDHDNSRVLQEKECKTLQQKYETKEENSVEHDNDSGLQAEEYATPRKQYEIKEDGSIEQKDTIPKGCTEDAQSRFSLFSKRTSDTDKQADTDSRKKTKLSKGSQTVKQMQRTGYHQSTASTGSGISASESSSSTLTCFLSSEQDLQETSRTKIIEGAVQWMVSAGINIHVAVQLNEDLSRLSHSLPKAYMLIDRAEWGRFKDRNLALLLSQLKDTTCDAEDLLREFDDHVQREKREDTSQSRADQLISPSYNHVQVWMSSSKTRAEETESKLHMVMADTVGALNVLGLNVEPARLHKPLMPETSSVIAVQVFGRDEERDLVIERLGMMIGRDNEQDHAIKQLGVPLTRSAKVAGKKAAALGMGAVASTSTGTKRLKGEGGRGVSTKTTNCCTGHVSVFPIFGHGGVGKTTLAQFIYNDTRVKKHFPMRVWVCVSDIFDKRRITKEIIKSVTGKEFMSSVSLDALQVELKKQLMDQKFLLVLDDVWPISNNEWEAFYALFRSGPVGSMVLLTTRFPKVANLVSTDIKPIELEGLPSNIFWEFFKTCAFDKQDPEAYPHLQVIGRSIADRLCGSPLAAKTLGRLLSMELTQQHWSTIQSSELWELSHQENEILPALQLSYLYLTRELKRCFALCSIFPKHYSFQRDEIVSFWVAQCLVESKGTMRLEDMGYRYLDDLRRRFLLQSDPKFPNQSRYVMHDLIHDMAQSVSVGECFLMKHWSYNNLQGPPHTVRHMSIEVDNEALGRMGGIQHLNRLRSLRFRKEFEVEASWFNHLSNILFLSLKGCKLVNLPGGICELSSLRFLDISGSSIQELPEKLWCLYTLQYFCANPSRLRSIHPDIIKLVNLRRIALPSQLTNKLSETSGLGNLSSLQNLRKFTVGRNNGQKISELKAMNQLCGVLSIWSLDNIQSREEAAEARLVDKRYLRGLILDWQELSFTPMSIQNGVLEGLHPPSSIEHIEIIRFRGDSFPPSWLKQDNLPALRSLSIIDCVCFKEWVVERRMPDIVEPLTTSRDGTLGGSVGVHSMQQVNVTRSNYSACLPFIGLTALRLHCCCELTNLDQCLSPEYLRSIQSIQIVSCWNLKTLPVHKLGGFVSLRDLKISGCSSLVCPREMVLPPSLHRLSIGNCGELDRSIKPGCLENLASLSLLCLENCPSVDSILHNSINTNNLKGLVLRHCSRLSSIGGSHALSSIKHVHISNCPKLTEVPEVQQPFLKKELRIKWEKELFKF